MPERVVKSQGKTDSPFTNTIVTKKGLHLIPNLLPPKEISKIRHQRRIQPLEAVDDQTWNDALAEGKFAFSYKDEYGVRAS
ncbi:MAG: hypothetical protein ABH950_05135 [Candidatus Altiarchaeota archaeon]